MRKKPIWPDGEKIRNLRQEKYWTQQDLANKAMVSKKSIERLEKGESTSSFTLCRVAGALESPPCCLKGNWETVLWQILPQKPSNLSLPLRAT